MCRFQLNYPISLRIHDVANPGCNSTAISTTKSRCGESAGLIRLTVESCASFLFLCFKSPLSSTADEHSLDVPRHASRGQKGIISCLAFNPDYSGCFAAGSYANSVGIYVENADECALELSGLEFGVTCLKWSPCGNYLWCVICAMVPTTLS